MKSTQSSTRRIPAVPLAVFKPVVSALPIAPANPGGAAQGRLPVGPASRDEALLESIQEPGARDVRNRMLEHGASTEFCASILRRVLAAGARGAYAIDEAAEAIGRSIPVRPSPKRKRGSHMPHLFAFAGPTGSGKTTTLAKLGRRLAGAGCRVLFASLDAAGTSALERVGGLASDTDRAEIPLVSIRGVKDLLDACQRRGPIDIILIDTPGLSPRDQRSLNHLAAELAELGSLGPMDLYLVLPATRSRASLRLTQEAFQRINPVACVLTKLDETDEPGAILSEVARAHLPVAFLSDGLDTRTHLDRPRAGDFADLLLRGKRQ